MLTESEAFLMKFSSLFFDVLSMKFFQLLDSQKLSILLFNQTTFLLKLKFRVWTLACQNYVLWIFKKELKSIISFIKDSKCPNIDLG